MSVQDYQQETDSQSLVHLRVSVAKMEGMLTQALTDQGARITRIEAETAAILIRLSEKGKALASHEERISANTVRIHELEEDNDQLGAKVLAGIGALVAVASLVIQFTPLGQ